MAAAEAALHSVAAVEAPLHPGQEADAAGIDGSPGVEICHERARPLVERRRGRPRLLPDQTGGISCRGRR